MAGLESGLTKYPGFIKGGGYIGVELGVPVGIQ